MSLKSIFFRMLVVFAITGSILGGTAGTASALTFATPQISLGTYHSCAINSSGGVLCWGLNDDGQLGLGYKTAFVASPAAVAGLSGVKSLGLGANFSCALTYSGSVKCWGNNDYGQLGRVPNNTSNYSPQTVSELSGVVSLSVGGYHACAILSTGDVKCWGENVGGQIGLGYTSTSISSPTVVPGLTGLRSLALGSNHSCALFLTGVVKCWGWNGVGQVGIGTTSESVSTPTAVVGLSDVDSIGLGSSYSCALMKTRDVKCWGSNGESELGTGFGANYATSPTTVNGLANVSTLVVGGYHACAVFESEQIKCWGYNQFGQLGLGTMSVSVPAPTTVSNLSNVRSLVLGQVHSCAVAGAGEVTCWGYNYFGELGLGYRSAPDPIAISIPTLVPNMSLPPVPSAPGIFVTELGTRQFTFTGTAPADDGGHPIISYAYSIDGQTWHSISETNLCEGVTVKNLSVDTRYTLQLKAENAYGSGAISSSDIYLPGVPEVPIKWNSRSEYGLLTQEYSYNVYGYHRDWVNRFEYSTDFGRSWTTVQDKSFMSGLFAVIVPISTHLLLFRACGLSGCGVNAQVRNNIYEPLPPNIDATTVTANSVSVDFSTNAYEWNRVGRVGYSLDGASYSVIQNTGSLTISGLSPGTQHTLVLKFDNADFPGHLGEPSLPISFLTSGTTPSAPTVSSVVAGNGQATVNFTASADNGGAAITNYEYSINGGTSWSAASPTQTSSPIIISGLTNGTSYSVKIRAVNSVGSGAESDAVSVKPVAPASAPTISGAIAGNGQATLSITAPSQINDSSLIGYDYSINNGSTWSSFPSATGPFTITGLTNATAYQVKVRAVNSAGAGEASAAVTVNPTSLVPAKPVISSVLGGNASVTVNIANPADVTAQSITGYHYSIDRGATYREAVVTNGSFTISGLTNGVSTSVQIRATNFNGTSLPSVAKSVIPATTPDAPSISRITRSAGALSIAFTATNTGGSAITGYQYSLDGGLTWVVPKTAVKSSPIRVTGLPNATNYQVSIRAVNGKGISVASTAVSASTPVVVPSAPVYTSITKTRTTIVIEFDAPANDGGGAITNYAYSTDSGRTWVLVSPASNATRVVITGLNPSTLYPVQIAAINSAGRGASSALTRVGTLH